MSKNNNYRIDNLQ